MALKIPPEVERKFGYYRRKIPEAFRKGIRVPATIVDQLAYNLAINRCIEAGVFDKAIKTPLGGWTLASMVLKELGDMRVHYESNFVAKFVRKGFKKNSVIVILRILTANGWIQIKERHHDALIGRGSCIVLEDIYDSIAMVFTQLVTEDEGLRALNERNDELESELKKAKELGLVEFKLRKSLNKYIIEYKLTGLGKYFRGIMGSCEVPLDKD